MEYVLLLFVVSIPQYLSKFQWDFIRYPPEQSLKNIGEIIAKVFRHSLSCYIVALHCG